MESQKLAIITGGTSGIGYALGAQLLRDGLRVIVLGRSQTRGQKAVAVLEKISTDVEFVQCDIVDHKRLEGVVREATHRHGQLDYMFNNAGISLIGEARDLDIEDWREIINVDLMGVVNGVAVAYPIMVDQGFGHIVLIFTTLGPQVSHDLSPLPWS